MQKVRCCSFRASTDIKFRVSRSVLFKHPIRVYFIVPLQYFFTIDIQFLFRLEGGPPIFIQDYTCLEFLFIIKEKTYRAITLYRFYYQKIQIFSFNYINLSQFRSPLLSRSLLISLQVT